MKGKFLPKLSSPKREENKMFLNCWICRDKKAIEKFSIHFYLLLSLFGFSLSVSLSPSLSFQTLQLYSLYKWTTQQWAGAPSLVKMKSNNNKNCHHHFVTSLSKVAIDNSCSSSSSGVASCVVRTRESSDTATTTTSHAKVNITISLSAESPSLPSSFCYFSPLNCIIHSTDDVNRW